MCQNNSGTLCVNDTASGTSGPRGRLGVCGSGQPLDVDKLCLLLAVGGSLVLVCEKAGGCCACQNIVDVTAPPCSRKTNDQADGYRRQNFSHGVTDPYVKFPEQIV